MDELGQIALKIKTLEERRAKLGAFLRQIKDLSLEGLVEKKLVYKVRKDPLHEKIIGAVDGGLSKHEYHGLDIILTRAVGVVCTYRAGKLAELKYYPSPAPKPKLTIVCDPYSDEEFIISSSLERQMCELALAKELAEKFSMHMLLLDGSIVPHGNDKPGKASAAWSRYTKVIKALKQLYEVNTQIAGCVEDSRSRRFCEIIAQRVLDKISDPRIPELKKVLMGTRDTNLLYHVLEQGERTAVFAYSESPAQHPILKDLDQFKNKIYSFYIKTAEFDRPLRIDFLAQNNIAQRANEIASIILAITPNSTYGCPAPLVEADVRAKLAERDATELHNLLIDRIGITPSLMRLRREQRPF